MEIILSEYQLSRLLAAAAEIGSTRSLGKAGLITPSICKQEACRIYTRAKVEKWIKAGKLRKSNDGSWNLDRALLDALNTDLEPIYKSIKLKNG